MVYVCVYTGKQSYAEIFKKKIPPLSKVHALIVRLVCCYASSKNFTRIACNETELANFGSLFLPLRLISEEDSPWSTLLLHFLG